MAEILEGRVAIVTGATAGVGKGIAVRLAAHGARVAVVARDESATQALADEICAAHGEGRAIGVGADVSTSEGTQAIVDTVMTKWGTIGILVNNAGRPSHRPFLENDDDEWHYDLDLKVLAAVRLVRQIIPIMRAAGGGRILNILSVGAKIAPANSSPTAVSRAGGLALTKLLSKEFAPDNILVNALLLGFAKSDQWVRQWKSEGRSGDIEDYYAELGKQIPLGRFAEPEEIGEFAAFLLSDKARYLTGAAINFDGGHSAVT